MTISRSKWLPLCPDVPDILHDPVLQLVPDVPDVLHDPVLHLVPLVSGPYRLPTHSSAEPLGLAAVPRLSSAEPLIPRPGRLASLALLLLPRLCIARGHYFDVVEYQGVEEGKGGGGLFGESGW
jgi:hypothetical protein